VYSKEFIVLRIALKAFDSLCDATCIVILNVTVAVVFLQVIARYVLQIAIGWTEEVARFAFIWMVFVGIAITERQKAHFRITFVVDRLSRGTRYGLWLVGELLVFGALIWLLLESFRFAAMGARQISAAMELRLHYVYSAVPAAVILAIVNRARQFAGILIERPENPFM
jgi:TRAP-type C4-dicarboxylate transport system permease small subunit